MATSAQLEPAKGLTRGSSEASQNGDTESTILSLPNGEELMPADPAAKVLIVDDDPRNLMALEAVLEDLQQPLVVADSGEEALRKVANDDFAVILLDVRMPGIDGFETARLIRERRQ